MTKKQPVKVIKIPLSSNERPKDRPANFPKMSRLYLEFFENKDKVIPDLLNKEYIPKNPGGDEVQERKKSSSSRGSGKKGIDKSSDRDSKHSNDDDLKKRLDKLLENSSGNSGKPHRDHKHENKSEHRSENKPRRDNDTESTSSSSTSTVSTASSISTKSTVSINENRDDHSESSVKLNDLLDDTDSESGSPKHVSPKHDNHPGKSPPTLSELQSQGVYIQQKSLRNVDSVPMSEQEEEDAKRELLFKFRLLKKSYPGAELPEFTVHSKYQEMKKTYDMNVRTLSLDSSVEQYKNYLIGGFMVCEIIFGNVLGFDMQGFTQEQIIKIHTYEKLLIELGEKSYVPTGSRWPVELRLLGLIIINAAFFLGTKALMKKTGANVLGMLHTMNAPQMQAPPPARKKMQGPNINLDDIPEVVPAGDPKK